jgi:ribosomal protein L37AE/L43A
MGYDGGMEERDFFTERAEQRPAQYTCPRCKRRNEYQVRWIRRTKKDRLPPGADARDRALYAKLRDYLIRMDDDVTCKTCGKRFEIPSHQSMVFLDSTSSRPNSVARPASDDDDDNRGNRS